MSVLPLAKLTYFFSLKESVIVELELFDCFDF